VVSKLAEARRFPSGLKATADTGSGWPRMVRIDLPVAGFQLFTVVSMSAEARYGVTGNCSSLNRMRAIVARIWRKWLSRRSWKGRLGWAGLWGLLERMPLPAARVVHLVYRRV